MLYQRFEAPDSPEIDSQGSKSQDDVSSLTRILHPGHRWGHMGMQHRSAACPAWVQEYHRAGCSSDSVAYLGGE